MRSFSVPLLSSFLAITLVACGPKERVDASSSSTATYDVVSEGDASGVASTINAPGEVTPPMTATNADTTTNLAITGQPAAPNATNGNLAGALPTTTAAPASVYIPPNSQNGVMRRTPSPYPPAATVPTGTIPPATTLPRTRPQPIPPTDTAMAPPTTTQPPTDTSQTDTSQQQVPSAKKKKDEPPPPPPPPPDDTDTTSTNPG